MHGTICALLCKVIVNESLCCKACGPKEIQPQFASHMYKCLRRFKVGFHECHYAHDAPFKVQPMFCIGYNILNTIYHVLYKYRLLESAINVMHYHK